MSSISINNLNHLRTDRSSSALRRCIIDIYDIVGQKAHKCVPYIVLQQNASSDTCLISLSINSRFRSRILVSQKNPISRSSPVEIEIN